MIGEMGRAQDPRGRVMVLLPPTRVRGASRRALPRWTRGARSLAGGTSSASGSYTGVVRPAWALILDMMATSWVLRMAVRRHATRCMRGLLRRGLMEYSVMRFMSHTPDHKGGGPVHITNPLLESVAKCAGLSCVVRWTGAPIQSESVQAVTAGCRREAEGTWGW